MGNCHARFGAGKIWRNGYAACGCISGPKDYLSLSFEMVAASMEAKRLGLCQKSLFVVPNHLTEQWASEFLRLYPSANILVTTKKDFETHNRKKFCARIATGDYDAIIMGHSQFERIPISRERQERLLYEQIDEITRGLQRYRPVAASVSRSSSWNGPANPWRRGWKSSRPRAARTTW